ncbi:MAG: NAD-dependent epimerase/dehydratase family protein [Fusobacterium sp.]|uniref:NAD-dependent epimerase/dehydratase family protein n=1 Tax=Fusobacterium sp. TaxID=68766 RepID=UPI002942539A|nr:NAD-dependent epimerase/dehydratase family protein [Fusobacterium sp.]MDY3060144.1 NAD-dependent epimerase/dehydratase family protein [Fusobacterium sp.]MEE1476885.1 NAD-dependent epimerase/dehydratase family protein [Fusobacterium sp.]
MKKVLVMGGNQFLGKRVCEILLEKKYEVFAINRGNRENLKGINFLKCDRNNEEELRKITENLKVDYIVDISAYTGKQADILQKVMSGKFKQYILISSASVYNNIESYPAQEESSKGKNEIWGQYAEDKYLAEKVTIENSDRYNFKYTIFRPFYIYGEENNLDREKYIFSRIENDLPIFIPNDGSNIIQFGYVDDLVEGIIYSFDNENFFNEDFNISGEEGLTIEKYIDICGEIVNKKVNKYFVNLEKEKPKARDWFPFRNVHLLGDITKLKNTGFKIEYSFKNGMKKTYNYLIKNNKLQTPKVNDIERNLYKKNNI